jgi:hypothetical protein
MDTLITGTPSTSTPSNTSNPGAELVSSIEGRSLDCPPLCHVARHNCSEEIVNASIYVSIAEPGSSADD